MLVSLLDTSEPELSLHVPFLVSTVSIDRPLLGFNVIEQLILSPKEGMENTQITVNLLCGAMNIQDDRAVSLVNLIQTELVEDLVTDRSIIKVGARPTVVPLRQVSHVKYRVEDLLAKGWIVESKSPYSAPVVCVRKKDGILQVCTDYWLLNQKTIPDRHPLPRIQDLIDILLYGTDGSLF